MGGEMDSYKKGGKMPSWLLEMFKKKAKKSMPTGGKLERATRASEDRVATDTEGLLDNLSSMDISGKEKRFGIVERYDEQGNPYPVKKGLLGEKRNIINPFFHPDEEEYIVGTVKNRNRLGKMLTGSDAKAEFGKGGKMYYVTGGEVPEGDDIPALDPNADFLKRLAVEDDDTRKDFLLDSRLKGPADGRLAGLTMASETTQRQGGFDPTLFEATRVAEKPKMTKEIVKKEEPKDPPKDIPPTPPRPPKETPQDPPKKITPPPPARTPSEGMTYANVGSYFNPGGERVYRKRADGKVTAVGMKEYEDQDRIPTGLRTDDGKRHFATREVYQMMQDEGVDPYSPEAAMFMEDAYKSNPDLFNENYNESEVMLHRMLHADKGITQAGREGKDEGYFFPDQLFGRMTPEQRRKQDLANVRAANAARKEAEAERKRKAAERRKADLAKRGYGGGGKLYHF